MKIEDIEKLSFDEAITKLEADLDFLEKSQKNQEDPSDSEVFDEALKLKEHCEKLLRKEREEIERVAKENNISLEDLHLDDVEDNND